MEMSARRADRLPVLNGSDIRVIAQGAAALPGNWHLDPVIDINRWGKPMVWVRQRGFAVPDMRAVSFERLGATIWISIHYPNLDQSGMSDGLPFDTFSWAFVYLSARLEPRVTEVIAPDGRVWQFSPALHVPL
jgi:hypothetical protein